MNKSATLFDTVLSGPPVFIFWPSGESSELCIYGYKEIIDYRVDDWSVCVCVRIEQCKLPASHEMIQLSLNSPTNSHLLIHSSM